MIRAGSELVYWRESFIRRARVARLRISKNLATIPSEIPDQACPLVLLRRQEGGRGPGRSGRTRHFRGLKIGSYRLHKIGYTATPHNNVTTILSSQTSCRFTGLFWQYVLDRVAFGGRRAGREGRWFFSLAALRSPRRGLAANAPFSMKANSSCEAALRGFIRCHKKRQTREKRVKKLRQSIRRFVYIVCVKLARY